jgi:hypothetical protein
VVFSNPDVIRRVNQDFIPVALKAAHVNHPPAGMEGELYAEIGRSKPAPQGICVVNSAGKVLAWSLSFDDEASIVAFLDHVVTRFRQTPDARHPVVAERFMKYPSQKLIDVNDNGQKITIPSQHSKVDRCPAESILENGTMVGRMIGRALDSQGQPIPDTIRQEHYMEARFPIPVAHQEELVAAVKQADGKPFPLPHEFARGLVGHAFLGQLDVNPLGTIPGSRNDGRSWEFTAQRVPSADSEIVRIRMDGKSHIAGGQDNGQDFDTDGRHWNHRVSLSWQGYLDIRDGQVSRLVMLANGEEQLRWMNTHILLSTESDVEHLMAGHPIDLDCRVRYGLIAE